MDIIGVIGLTLLGAVFGSFAGAQVWRLRLRQLKEDKAAGEEYSPAEYKRLSKVLRKNGVEDRSACLHCGHRLAWFDLLPIISWFSLRGKCRYCGKKIGYFEIVMEIATALLFAASYVFWPFGFLSLPAVLLFVLWLIAVVLLVILAAYDMKWKLLPDVINFSFILVAAAYLVIGATTNVIQVDALSVLAALGALPGLYGVLYLISRGGWIGFGDVKLAIGLALLLADWKLALFALFMANFVGCLIVLPSMVGNKLNAKSKIAFGPLLIIGMFISFWWGTNFLTWFFSQSGLYL